MSFIVEDDDDYSDHVKNFSVVEHFIVESTSKFFIIKDRRSRCYIYEENKRDDFLKWWSASHWAKTHSDSDKKKKKQMYWDEDKKTTMWKHFDEDVIIEDDTSKIVCKRCALVLEHSFIDSETNTIKTHLNSKQCRKSAKVKSLSKLTLVKNWKKVNQVLLWFFLID